MQTKPLYVEGITLYSDETVCWECMTDDEYQDSESIPIFGYSEFDYPIWCQRCEDPIPVNLTRDGEEYLKEMMHEDGRVKQGTLDVSPWDYLFN